MFTHQGRKSPNEDAARVFDPGKNVLGIRKFVVLADGMGGYQAGEVASAMALESISKAVMAGVAKAKTPDDLKLLVIDAVKSANTSIYQRASTAQTHRGMGTTIALAVVLEDRAVVANVGDSRIYLVTENRIEQVSEDHTALAEAMKTREMTGEEIKSFPYKHNITRALGEENAPEVFIRQVGMPNDCVLLACSDGLTDVIDDKTIHEQVRGTPDIQAAVDNLGKKAFHSGSTDNITVIGIETGRISRDREVGKEKDIVTAPRARAKSGQKSNLPMLVAALSVLLFGLLGVVAGMYWYSQKTMPLPPGDRPAVSATEQAISREVQVPTKEALLAKPEPTSGKQRAKGSLKSGASKSTKAGDHAGVAAVSNANALKTATSAGTGTSIRSNQTGTVHLPDQKKQQPVSGPENVSQEKIAPVQAMDTKTGDAVTVPPISSQPTGSK